MFAAFAQGSRRVDRAGVVLSLVLVACLGGCATEESMGQDGGGGQGGSGGGDGGVTGPMYSWTRAVGSSESESVWALASAPDMTMVAVGTFAGTVDFSGGAAMADSRTAKDRQDVFITKLDHTADYHWTHAFGGAGIDRGVAVGVAADGSVYATGSFRGTVDFDPPQGIMPGEHKSDMHVSDSGSADVFVTKLSQSGKYQWTRTFGGPGDDEGRAVLVTAAGVTVIGTGRASFDLDPGAGAQMVTSAGERDVFVVKLGADGAYVDGRLLGGRGDETVGGAVAGGGGAVLAGAFSGETDWGGAGKFTSLGSTDALVVRLGADGTPAWAGTWGGTGADLAQSVAVASSGEMVVAGSFSDEADLAPGSATSMVRSAGRLDTFVTGLAADGSFGWARSLGSSADDEPSGITFGEDGGPLVVGRFVGQASLGGLSRTSSGAFPNLFLVAFSNDGTGTPAWIETLEASFEEPGDSIEVLTDGSIALAGWFQGRVDFNPSPAKADFKASSGDWDLFVTRFIAP